MSRLTPTLVQSITDALRAGQGEVNPDDLEVALRWAEGVLAQLEILTAAAFEARAGLRRRGDRILLVCGRGAA